MWELPYKYLGGRAGALARGKSNKNKINAAACCILGSMKKATS